MPWWPLNSTKKHVLIVNQNALDVFSSFFLAITYSLRLCNIYLTGSTGYWLCTLLLSECFSWSGTIGSTINLAIISVERYLKIVHRTWSKKHLRKWMIYSAAAFAWIGSTIYLLALVFPTTKVIDGVCYPYTFWNNEMAAVAHLIWSFVSFCRHYTLDLYLLLLAHSGCHSSSGKCDGRSRHLRWIKHQSNPLQSYPSLRHQNNGFGKPSVRHHIFPKLCLRVTCGPESKLHILWHRLLRVNIRHISVQLRQSFHLRYQARSSERNPATYDSLQEDWARSGTSQWKCRPC